MSSTKEVKLGEEGHNEEDHGHHGHVHGPNCNHGHSHEALKPIVRDAPKVGRNDPCICGSLKKYKKCCGN
jgi:preprotein translocase subunit SecA